ncbi:syntabulin isoform X2 [Eucyclogobius newberryi]|uniref:syntabulin isoform X2 n=1 Tax=Eucyclogobius newberryi TaxID=166745 RepID=UPI003B59D6F4
MGPFQHYEKSALKTPRSRIPRLVLNPCQPKDKSSPLSDSPYSEEEGKDSDHSKGTISTNSFYSDDTGCPTSKSISPFKTPSGSEQSAHSSPVLPERTTKVKRVRVVAEGCGEHSRTRQKRELRSAMKHKGSEADFSSSSSTGSPKTFFPNSVGKKVPTHSRTPLIRPLPIFKPTGSPVANHDAELYAPYGTPPRVTTSMNSSSNSSLSARACLGRYHSCGDHHGIRAPTPEQYLTPLQQKEVAIRHLRTKLLESENRVRDKDTEIEDLKGQMSRMREDWIEEECHRVEAQLSLKEARKEIKQLRQVVETMKSSLMEKDKGIQKYFIDINIQNRKLESLLHSMELAQSGNSIDGEQTLDFISDGSNGRKKMLGEADVEMEHGAEAMADSGLLVNDEMANRVDILEQVFMSTAVDCSQDASGKLRVDGEMLTALSEVCPSERSAVGVNIASAMVTVSKIGPCQDDKQVQTDPMCSDIQTLLLQLLKFHGVTFDEPVSTSEGLQEVPTARPQLSVDESPQTATDSGIGSAEPAEGPKFMEELDFDCGREKPCLSPGLEVVEKRYWSNNFLVDLVAVAAPVLPTVAWMYSRHGVDGSTPFYNIAALIRGCCIMGLHSLRHVANRPGT